MRCVVLAVLVLLVVAAPAHAQVFGPPNGKVFTGLTGSNSVEKFSEEVGKRPAVFGFFTYWNRPTSTRSATPSRPARG